MRNRLARRLAAGTAITLVVLALGRWDQPADYRLDAWAFPVEVVPPACSP